MQAIRPPLRCLAVLRIGLAFGLACFAIGLDGIAQEKGGATSQTTVIELEGTVQSAAARTVAWRSAQTNEVLAPFTNVAGMSAPSPCSNPVCLVRAMR